MAKKFSELEARIDAEVKKALAEMPLNELRNARGLSQKMLAEALRVQQPAIEKMERRTEMYTTKPPWVANLRSSPGFLTGMLEYPISRRSSSLVSKIEHISIMQVGYNGFRKYDIENMKPTYTKADT